MFQQGEYSRTVEKEPTEEHELKLDKKGPEYK
jgi:hypothetical protein